MGTGFIAANAETAPSTPATAGQVLLYIEQTTLRPALKDSNGNVVYLTDRQPRNLLLNSGLTWWQSHAGATLATYATLATSAGRSYGPDGFGFTPENASVQVKQVDSEASAEAGLASRYYCELKKITNAGKVVISQVVPADQAFPLRARIVRLTWSGILKTGTGATTMRMGLIALSSSGTADSIPATFVSAFGAASTDPIWGANLAAIAPTTVFNCASSGNGATCTLTTAWQTFSASFLVPAGTQNVVAAVWSNGQLAVSDEMGFAQVTLTDGYELADYVVEDQADELLKCQRQFFKTFLQGTAPGTNPGVNTGEWTWENGVAAAAGNHSPGFRYPVPMRASPSLTFYNPAGANALIRDETAGADTSANSTVGPTANGFRLDYTGAVTGIVGGVAGVHFTADARL